MRWWGLTWRRVSLRRRQKDVAGAFCGYIRRQRRQKEGVERGRERTEVHYTAVHANYHCALARFKLARSLWRSDLRRVVRRAALL
jgi:hypothetical protein